MIMSLVFSTFLAISIISSVVTGNSSSLSSAISEGAQQGITLAISIAGSLCLWTGIGKLLESAGVTGFLSRLLKPVLHRLFPSSKTNPRLAGYLSGNICANILGLGNAATPMGIQSVREMNGNGGIATDEMCRLIVLNTASIQLIPTNVAAIRAALGSAAPFDLLPCVWVTSLCSAGVGVAAAVILGKVWPHD